MAKKGDGDKKGNAIGFDPLAWMSDEGQEDSKDIEKVSKKASEKPAVSKKKTVAKKAKKKGDGLEIDILESSFEALAPHGEELTKRFYEALYAQYPEVKPLFSGTTIEQQHKKLLAALKLVVGNLRKPETLVKALKDLGQRHQNYGAVAAHYPVVAKTLLGIMEDLAGDLWTREIEDAWTQALNVVAETMLQAYQEDKVMATSKEQAEESVSNMEPGSAIFNDLSVLKEIMENATVNIMIADADENVVFVNKKAQEVLVEIESELATYVPGFSVATVAGGSIHRYHKDPQKIKDILHSIRAGEGRKGEITPGRFVFEHETRVINDSDGNKLGYIVQWHDVTERRIKEEEAFRLQRAVDSAQTAMMTLDRDFNITYVNESTKNILQEHETTLSAIYPGFSADKAVGTCIDMFHKNPAHQRRILEDPRNLPYEADIQVGPLTFHIRVGKMEDLDGNYIGNTLEWSDVTTLRMKEQDTFRLQRAIDGAQTAMMMIDRDLVITYANESTLGLLRDNSSDLRAVYPGFDVEKIVGTCIDIFHKDPKYQRRILDDPANLPHSADIQVGPLMFNINAAAMLDLDGNYIGNTLEWSDVTELRKREEDVARLSSAIDGAAANIMLCDEDLNITYVNPAVQKMMGARQADLRQVFPGFDTNNLVGQCIDGFHKNPAHQRALLSDVSRLPAMAEMEVAGLNFRVNATAIRGPGCEYRGNMVQWEDITEQKDAERQIETLISSAMKGELSSRLEVKDYQGFMRMLGEGINQLLETVVEPIRQSTQVVKSLSEGDLRVSMTGDYDGEFADMRDALNQSMDNLKKMVGQIQSSSTNIVNAAGEIAQGNSDLSQRTEEQASSLEETASSMEELTGTVKQNADNARQANQLAAGAREQAEKGGEVVQRAVGAMAEINTSSKKISDIIGVIDEIAFQTNLLALNAAVEAARAGEQGRGFAVVAGEVRNLAQRSAGAAKEIKALIQDSVEKVTDGTKLVDQSGQTLEEIVAAVKKVSDIIAEIAAASQEQSTGIEQVNKAVTQMDQVTQQNAALVEEAAAASESMDEQARGLSSLITFFKIDDGDSGFGAAQISAQQPVAAAVPVARPVAPRPAAAAPAPRSAPRPASNDSDDEWEEF